MEIVAAGMDKTPTSFKGSQLGHPRRVEDNFSRPARLKWFLGGIVSSCFLLAFVMFGAVSPWLVSGPLLGHVTDHQALLWVKASRECRPSVWISESEDFAHVTRLKGALLTESNGFAGRIEIGGLQPKHRYFYKVILDGEPAMSAPFPSFVTAPTLGEQGHLRFAFFSCSGYEPYDPAAGWADLGLRTNIDLILMLGDNHYGNTSDLLKQREAYLGQRFNPSFRFATSRMPTYAIWDDHDFGPNDSDSTLAGKEGSLKAFLEHWANPSYGEPDNPGVYFKFSRGDVDFFLLDDRYYRSPNKAPEGPTKTMLGAKQLAWLKRSLVESKAKIKVLAAGGEWQTYGTADSWTSFPRERDEIFRWIQDHSMEGVILISGDRHFTAGYQVQKRFIEITSGPIGAMPAESKPTPEMILYHGKGHFYCVYDVDTRPSEPVLTIEMYQVGIGLVDRRTFRWAEINGHQSIEPFTLPPSAPAKGSSKP